MDTNLPIGWIEVELNDIANVEWGNTSITKKSYVEDGYPAFSAAGQDGNLSHYEYEGEGIVLSAIGARCGKCFFANGKWTAIKNTIVIRPILVNSKLLYYYLNDANKWEISGSGQPFITLATARKNAFLLPPLPEQQLIVKKLDTLMARISNCKTRLEKIPTLLRNFRQSVLAAAVSGELTKEWREENGLNNWKEVELESITEVITDGDHQAPPKSTSGIPFIVISNINNGKLKLEETKKFVPEEYYNNIREYRKPKKDDILYTVTGSIGIPVLVDTDKKFCFQRHIGLIRVKKEIIVSKFLYYALGSAQMYQQAISVATGIAQLTIPLSGIRKFLIDLPELEEQKEIVRKVKELFHFADSIEARYQKAKGWFDKLPQAILAKAFRGELVAQNENDEPASELLKRIQQAKQINHKPSSKAKKRKLYDNDKFGLVAAE